MFHKNDLHTLLKRESMLKRILKKNLNYTGLLSKSIANNFHFDAGNDLDNCKKTFIQFICNSEVPEN
jgi:hypothetical protein